MQKIDAHQHFWKYHPVRDSWITNDMNVIQMDFMPNDLEPLLKQHCFEGCVVVQSDQSEKENEFQLNNANKHEFIKGVIGWVDLVANNIEDRLLYYSQFDKLKGFRHVLQGEAQRDYMLQPSFLQGISLLHTYGFTYDILIFPDQLKFVPTFVSQFPLQLFVIDHIAKPNIKEMQMEDWKKDIVEAAQFENVYCKLSGMVTEADWKGWKREDFEPYIQVILKAFGIDKIMFGSDWPVCNVAATYGEVVGLVEDYFSNFSIEDKEKVFGLNAIKFYKLK